MKKPLNFSKPPFNNAKIKMVEKPDYLLTVANRYLALKGGVVVTSLDIARILDWEIEGVPLGAALAGIERAFTALAPGKPYDLGTCLPYVRKAIPEFMPTQPDRMTEAPPPYDPQLDIKEREALWRNSTEESKTKAFSTAKAILKNDLSHMSKITAEETLINLAMRILASHQGNMGNGNG